MPNKELDDTTRIAFANELCTAMGRADLARAEPLAERLTTIRQEYGQGALDSVMFTAILLGLHAANRILGHCAAKLDMTPDALAAEIEAAPLPRVDPRTL